MQIAQDNFIKVTSVSKTPQEYYINTHYIVSMKPKGDHTILTVKGSLADDIAPFEVKEPVQKLMWDIKIGM